MSKVTAINEIIEKRNLLRKWKERHATSVSIDIIIIKEKIIVPIIIIGVIN